jgi:hypothetical protein
MWATHTNTGTVPLKAQSIEILTYRDGVLADITGYGAWDNMTGHFCGDQIDPGKTYTVVNTFHVLQGAEPGHTYSVVQHITFVNWNEYDDLTCNLDRH